MEWLLFTYWLPSEPSRKRVFVWRQLKKIGALSTDEGGWLLPKRKLLSTKIENVARTVEDMGGTINLYTVTHFNQAQERRAMDKFQKEREREYSELIKECQKTAAHIERERQADNFNVEEVEELEGDLRKLKQWLTEAKRRDFWGVALRDEVESQTEKVEASLDDFIQKTYEKLHSSKVEHGTN